MRSMPSNTSDTAEADGKATLLQVADLCARTLKLKTQLSVDTFAKAAADRGVDEVSSSATAALSRGSKVPAVAVSKCRPSRYRRSFTAATGVPVELDE